MSEFEHLTHLIEMHIGNASSRSETLGEFMTHGFALLDAWFERASDEDKQQAFAFTQASAFPHPYVGAWWFQREQTNPQQWNNTWSANDFKRQVVRARTNYWGAEHFIARIDWARHTNDWKFFDSWDLKIAPRLIKKLCQSDLSNPAMALWLRDVKQNNPDLFAAVYHELPAPYLQNHCAILPESASVIAQSTLVELLKQNDLHAISSNLDTLQNVNAPLQSHFVMAVSTFWERWQNTKEADAVQLEHLARQFADVFPSYTNQVLPHLDKDSPQWAVAANMVNPERIGRYVRNKTEQMIQALFVFPSMQPWVDFWTDLMSIPGWRCDHMEGGDIRYMLGISAVPRDKVNVDKIEQQLAPHWDFFEHNAPKMGRAMAGVVAFLGGNPPHTLCDFSNLFDFEFQSLGFVVAPPEFKTFIESEVQRATLIKEVDERSAPQSVRKM